MKRMFTLLFVLITCVVSAQELAPTVTSFAKNHLLTVNSQWTYFSDYLPKEEVAFTNDTDRISYHLENVCRLLKVQNTEHLSAEQLKNRNNTISILEGYAARKVFPTNLYHTKRQPYFIDNYEVHCAVGYLVKETGFPEISKEIARTQNYAYVKEIQSEALLQWAKDYGFSVQELALIQPGYAPRTEMSKLGEGTNGEVVDLHIDELAPNDLVIAGNFTELNNQPCLNIGVYADDNFSCFGNGISGEVKGVLKYSKYDGGVNLLIYGDFVENGIHYPMASFNDGTWSYIEISQRPNHGAKVGIDDYSRYIGIAVENELHNYEVYQYYAQSYHLRAKIYGELNCIRESYTPTLPHFGGDFDSVYIVAHDSMYHANNVLLWVGSYVSPMDLNIDEVHVIKDDLNAIYIGGKTIVDPNGDHDEVFITRYMNGSCQPIVNGSYLMSMTQLYPYQSTFKDLKIIGNYLYASGDVELDGSWEQNSGRGLVRLNLINGQMQFVTRINGVANELVEFNGNLILAGDYTQNFSNTSNHTQDIPNIGVVQEAYASVDKLDDFQLIIYPNPVERNSTIHIELPETVTLSSLHIIDMKGSSTELAVSKEIQLPNLTSGTYVLVVQTTDGTLYREKLIVQ
ncbi:Por secretion system C-terminal sorting domain-containing protein [Lishizhenia tianjinensis]|uniref:Por secretion system C-terminal sorting domain-containing protein n=1 Tax=Lishizhenia tianjinensis TaxID=477690 RepID=A0A1I7AKK0_9FLAO|nr:T9SS type A sorting domain-containing protein [Lishizhenia tianjinensis]SFT75410.1 Por secretion system C-terminal sorting domain-containing protein [Lishizhenia tianjinensis]